MDLGTKILPIHTVNTPNIYTPVIISEWFPIILIYAYMPLKEHIYLMYRLGARQMYQVTGLSYNCQVGMIQTQTTIVHWVLLCYGCFLAFSTQEIFIVFID